MKKNNNEKSPLIIFGAGGHATSVANVALSNGYEIKNFVDRGKVGEFLMGVKIIEDILEIDNFFLYNFAIAIGDNYTREKIYKDILNTYGNLNFPVLIHESACISYFSEIEIGTVVMPQAVVGPNSKIGKFCIINTKASIDHDCLVSDFSSLAPAAVTGGSVEIGIRSAISINATIKNSIKIGKDCVIGANSYVNKNLFSNQVAYGIPAKFVRFRSPNDSYLD